MEVGAEWDRNRQCRVGGIGGSIEEPRTVLGFDVVAVRTRLGEIDEAVQALGDVVADGVLQSTGLLVETLGHLELLDQEPLDSAVLPEQPDRLFLTGVGEVRATVFLVGDQPLFSKVIEAVCHARRGDVQAVGDGAGLRGLAVPRKEIDLLQVHLHALTVFLLVLVAHSRVTSLAGLVVGGRAAGHMAALAGVRSAEAPRVGDSGRWEPCVPPGTRRIQLEVVGGAGKPFGAIFTSLEHATGFI